MLRQLLDRFMNGRLFLIFTNSKDAGVAWDRATAGVVLIAVVVWLLTFGAYGISWDEPFHQTYSMHVLDWYSSFGDDDALLRFRNNYLYGSVVHVVSGLAQNLVGYEHAYVARKLIGGLWGFVTLLAVMKSVHLLTGSSRAVFFSVLLTLINPIYYGHAFINSKDVPFASMYLWSVYFLIRVVQSFPKFKWGDALGLAVFVGLTLGIRIGGLILYAYLLSVLGLLVVKTYFSKRHELKDSVKGALYILACVIPISYLIMIVFWPWAQLEPFNRPFEALSVMSKFPWIGPVHFQGELYQSDELPWYFIPKLMLWQNTEVFILGLILFMLNVPLVLFGRDKRREALWLLVIVSIFPVVYVIGKGSILYDNYRHLLFVIPILGVISALGFEESLKRIAKRNAKLGRYAVVFPLLLFAFPTIHMLRLFPYEYTYYNDVFAGGPRAAYQEYESDYWGVSILDVMHELEEDLERRSESDEKFVIKSNEPSFPVRYFIRTRSKRMVYSKGREGPWHYYISITRFKHDEIIPGEVILSVGRYGRDFVLVKENPRFSKP